MLGKSLFTASIKNCRLPYGVSTYFEYFNRHAAIYTLLTFHGIEALGSTKRGFSFTPRKPVGPLLNVAFISLNGHVVADWLQGL